MVDLRVVKPELSSNGNGCGFHVARDHADAHLALLKRLDGVPDNVCGNKAKGEAAAVEGEKRRSVWPTHATPFRA